MESIDQPMLVIDGGDNDEKTIPIGKTTVQMGRLPDNGVVVNETGVSRNHAEIVGIDSGYYLRDLNSTNGTVVNHTRIGESEHLLHDGDRIRLASCEVSFVFRYFAASTLEMTIIKSPVEEGAEDSRQADRDQGDPGEGAQAISASELEAPVETFEATVEPVDEEVYEGTVKLKVEAEGDIQQVVQFVQELRQNSQFRVLRLVSSSQTDVDISLGLREPLRLRGMLAEIDGVSQATQPDASKSEAEQDESGEGGSEDQVRLISVKLSG